MSEIVIEGMGLFTPGFAGVKAWTEGAADEEAMAPAGALIERRARRRTSALTRALADAYAEALADTPADGVGAVFGSALGEASTMIGLLDQMFREGKPVSPMRFAMSVHNAAGGVVATSTKNQGFTTSIGADFDTPAMALAEGIALARTHGTRVIVACGDEQAPADLVDDDQRGWEMLAAAVALAPASLSESRRVIGEPFIGEASYQAPDAPRRVAQNPQMGLVDLISMLQTQQAGSVRLDRGRGQGFCVEVSLG